VTTTIQNSAVRLITEGILVSRATATLPATAAQNIFTISGGRILLVALVGEVTTIIQAQATTVKVTSTPTTGSAIDMSTATADINALEVGGRISLANPPAAATILTKTNAGYTNLDNVRTIVPIGQLSYTTGATSTGSIKWDLVYIPLDTAATVVAA
jgi:hypothetical protein